MKFWISLALLTMSASVAAAQSPQQRIYLELENPKVTENGESVIEIGGKCGSGEVLAFHLPQKGWFVASVNPFAGYDFRKVGKLESQMVTFKANDRSYAIISDQPISKTSGSLDLWVVHISPPADKSDAQSKAISCSTDFKYWLETTLLRDEKK